MIGGVVNTGEQFIAGIAGVYRRYQHNGSNIFPLCCSAHHMRVFYRIPAGYMSERKTGNGARRKAEKEEYGLLYAVICCAQPYNHPLSPILRVISPARGHGYQD
jgi:hypothetical protein